MDVGKSGNSQLAICPFKSESSGPIRLSSLFLALSKSCARVLAHLNCSAADERSLFPAHTTLYVVRNNFLEDVKNREEARILFARDWRETCLK